MEKKAFDPPRISFTAYLTLILIIFAVLFQSAFVKTVYNLPFFVVEATFNETFCLSEKCYATDPEVKIGSTIFWSVIVAAEPLGAIPALLTGTNVIEKYGRISAMLFASVPIAAGLILQGVSPYMRTAIFVPLGRIFHSFGATWLVLSCGVFTTDLLVPKIKLPTLFSIFSLLLAALFPVVHLLGLPQTLGSVQMWSWLHAVSGGMLLLLVIVVIVIPESPRFLNSASDKSQMDACLAFYYKDPVTVDEFKMTKLSERFWSHAGRQVSVPGRRESYTIWELIERKRNAEQIRHVHLTILCEIIRTLAMSNVVYVLLAVSLWEGLEVRDVNFVNFEIICAFCAGFLAAFISFRLGQRAYKVWVTLLCTGFTILAYATLVGMGFFKQYLSKTFSSSMEIFELAIFLCLFILFASYNVGIAALPQNIGCDKMPALASQTPAMILAMSIAKGCEIFVTGFFLPVLRYCGPGFAWCLLLVPLVLCYFLLVIWLPKEAKRAAVFMPAPDPKAGKIPLVIYPDVKSPASPIEPRPRSASFCTPTSVLESSVVPQRKKSSAAAIELAKRSVAAIKLTSKRRSRSASPRLMMRKNTPEPFPPAYTMQRSTPPHSKHLLHVEMH